MEWEESWQHIRSQIKARDCYRCRVCRVPSGLTVHHIVPRAYGGRDEPANLITLCESCHNQCEPFTESDRGWEWIMRLHRLHKQRAVVHKKAPPEVIQKMEHGEHPGWLEGAWHAWGVNRFGVYAREL